MSLADQRVLVTGISGFVGSHLAKYLVDQGASVYGLIRRRADGSMPKNLAGISSAVVVLEGDITDMSSLANALDESEPDIIFHLAAQSYVPKSFTSPQRTILANVVGTSNLLEVIRQKNCPTKVVFAGSSEEYGLVVSSEQQFARLKDRYGSISPQPNRIPELPIDEDNPLRPISPYAITKAFGDYLMRNYCFAYGVKTIVSRGFNHEGPGRGPMFVTSQIASQIARLKRGEVSKIEIGNVNAFRDWSYVMDICKGYCLLAEKGNYGEVYNLGSQRTNSVLSYILLALDEAGFHVSKIETFLGEKKVDSPSAMDKVESFGVEFEQTSVDKLMLKDELEYTLNDKGILAYTDNGVVPIEFDPTRFRPSDVPILIADTTKVRRLGFHAQHTLQNIIREQLNYYIDPQNRNIHS